VDPAMGHTTTLAERLAAAVFTERQGSACACHSRSGVRMAKPSDSAADWLSRGPGPD